MLLELHCHSAEHSPCSVAPAVESLRQALRRGLQGLVLTDHHYCWPEAELDRLRREAGVPSHFLVLSGQEVSTPDLGHVLVLGPGHAIDEGTAASEIRRRWPEAALVRAHPYRRRLAYAEGELPGPGLDAAEILSSNHTIQGNSRGIGDWHRLRFTATAGTDAHGQAPAGLYPTQFDHPVASIRELAAEIRGGRCRPFLKEIVHAGANAVVTEVVIGTKGDGPPRPRIVLRRLAHRGDWERARRRAALISELRALGFAGGRYRLPAVLGEDAGRRTIIEEGVRGRSLIERLREAGDGEARRLVELAAGWLAHLHALPPGEGGSGPFLESERRRLAGYEERFGTAGHAGAGLVRRAGAAILEREKRLLQGRPELLVRCHGDYHPKNVLVGRDDPDDASTAFAAAIDLERSTLAPRAFDVGWFLAHWRHQLDEVPGLLAARPAGLFLEAYRRAAGAVEPDFDEQLALFEGRAGLSIAAYLVKLGLGGRPVVGRLLSGAAAGAGIADAVKGRRAPAGRGPRAAGT